MRREIPILITLFVGILMVVSFFLPGTPLEKLSDVFKKWFQIIASTAILLGSLNLVLLSMKKIQRNHEVPYNIVLLAGLIITTFTGIFMEEPEMYVNINDNLQKMSVHTHKLTSSDKVVGEMQISCQYLIGSCDRLIDLNKDNSKLTDGINKLNDLKKAINIRQQEIRNIDVSTFSEKTVQSFVRDLESFNKDFITASSKMNLGDAKKNPKFDYIYKHFFQAMQGTMFSLLAFFIASAAFRAFRMKSFESGLLLGAAIIVMLGRVPIGLYISPYLPMFTEWIMSVPQTAGQTAIMIGAALGVISSSLKIIFGIERSYLGGE